MAAMGYIYKKKIDEASYKVVKFSNITHDNLSISSVTFGVLQNRTEMNK